MHLLLGYESQLQCPDHNTFVAYKFSNWIDDQNPMWGVGGAFTIHVWALSSGLYLRRLEKSLGIPF